MQVNSTYTRRSNLWQLTRRGLEMYLHITVRSSLAGPLELEGPCPYYSSAKLSTMYIPFPWEL